MPMRTRLWVAYGVFAAASTAFGVLLTLAVWHNGPVLVVAGLIGVSAAVLAVLRQRAGAVVLGAAAVSAVGLSWGWLWWLAWSAGLL